MRFSVRSRPTLYLLLIFIITWYSIADSTPFSSFDHTTIGFGQFGGEQNGEHRVNPITTINAAIDGNNNAIANNGSTTSNTMKFSFSGIYGIGINIYKFECRRVGKA